jgi:abortive infection bacteriophage resistance protein
MPETIKPALSFQEQTEHLKKKGLGFADEAFAIDVLSRINYYRLINAYGLDFLETALASYEAADKNKIGFPDDWGERLQLPRK